MTSDDQGDGPLQGLHNYCLMCGNDYDDPDHIYGCPNSPHFEWDYEVSDSRGETTTRRMLEQRAEAEDCSVRDLLYGEIEPGPTYGVPHLPRVHQELMEMDGLLDDLKEHLDLPVPEFEPETSLYTDALVSSMGARRRAHQVWIARIRAGMIGEDVIVVGPDGAKKIDHETLEMEDYDLDG